MNPSRKLNIEYKWLAIMPLAVAQLDEGGEKTFVPQAVAQMAKEGALTPTAAMCLPEQHLIEKFQRLVPFKPIGVSEYELTRALPDNLTSSLPTVEKIEERLEEKS